MILRAFIAGLAFPATILPFAYTALYCLAIGEVRTEPMQFMPLYLPVVFGLWNAGHVKLGDKCPIKSPNCALWASGISLGLIAALLGVFVLDIPAKMFGLTGDMQYLPLALVPLLYGVIWRYVVGCLNKLVGL